MSKPIKVTLAFDRSTKGTHVFKNTTPGAAVSSLYVDKAALPEPGNFIELTLTSAEA